MTEILGGLQYDWKQRVTKVSVWTDDECDCCDEKVPIAMIEPPDPIDPSRICRKCLLVALATLDTYQEQEED